jgi:hypothetical protein
MCQFAGAGFNQFAGCSRLKRVIGAASRVFKLAVPSTKVKNL